MTKEEKEICLLTWGGIPMTKNWEKPDEEFIRNSHLFKRKLEFHRKFHYTQCWNGTGKTIQQSLMMFRKSDGTHSELKGWFKRTYPKFWVSALGNKFPYKEFACMETPRNGILPLPKEYPYTVEYE